MATRIATKRLRIIAKTLQKYCDLIDLDEMDPGNGETYIDSLTKEAFGAVSVLMWRLFRARERAAKEIAEQERITAHREAARPFMRKRLKECEAERERRQAKAALAKMKKDNPEELRKILASLRQPHDHGSSTV